MVSTVFTYGESEIPLTHKPSLRAKRLSLRLSSKEGILVLTVPPRTTPSQISIFLKQCGPWVDRQMAKISKPMRIEPGMDVNIHGEVFRCTIDPLRRKPVLCEATKTLRVPPLFLQTDLHNYFKKLADKILPDYVLKAAKLLGQQVEKISIRDQKTRWGSCSGQKTISLSWRLILAPPEVAHYVCVHEAVHLLHMNHSPAFWKAVESLCPAYKIHKKWLKIHGPSLMGL